MEERIPKCKKRIINAFIELRRKKELEKITVTELIKKADVNKSTFYVYYHDIYDLSEQLEEEIINSIAASIRHPERMIEDTPMVTRELFAAFSQHQNMTSILFSGSRSSILPEKIMAKIEEIIYAHYPLYKDDLRIHVIMTYQIYGSYFAFRNHMDQDQMYVASIIAEIGGRINN